MKAMLLWERRSFLVLMESGTRYHHCVHVSSIIRINYLRIIVSIIISQTCPLNVCWPLFSLCVSVAVKHCNLRTIKEKKVDPSLLSKFVLMQCMHACTML